MTAICALWYRDGRAAREDGARMLSALHPHGVDHQVSWDAGPLALGRVLYRTLPEDIYDRQPVVVCGGRQRLVADIRLDNRAELASVLGLRPGAAAVLSDSALLACAWERWGRDCLAHIIGDFAFIVWDEPNQRLFAARDHVGQRPLVYCTGKDFIAVASMPKGVLALPSVPMAVDVEKLAQGVAVGRLRADNPLYDTRTYYAGIRALPPRHALTFTAGTLTLDRYWEIEPQPTLHLGGDDEYVERATEIFDRAVHSRLRRVGAIGSELSAGLDSSTITVTASRRLAAEGSGLTAFTAVPRNGAAAVAPRGRAADEGPGAAAVASRLANVEHVSLPYPLRSPLPVLNSLIESMDRPVSALCYLQISEQLGREAHARGLKVMLSGFMGNLTLSYDGFERLPILLWQGHWREWAREVVALSRSLRQPPWRTAAGQIMAALPPGWQQALTERFIPTQKPGKPALGAGFMRRYRGSRNKHGVLFHPGDHRHPSALWARRLATQTGFGGEAFVLAGLLARHGVEYRSPAKDKRLIDFCMALPLEQLCRNGRTRLLVRRMMRDHLPPEVLAQRRRGYQAAGWLDNLRAGQEEIRALLRRARTSATARAVLDLDRLERLAATIPQHGEEDPAITTDYRRVLSSGLAAAQFIRHVEGDIEGDVVRPVGRLVESVSG